ncbi:MFS transporter [Phytomonospora sp. NPDC050363]|uniref:MFS transporter n=1 Tax=Phytomonospora sp. NPDC050363 TaxID=3155642 RepID=UPI0033CB92A5
MTVLAEPRTLRGLTGVLGANAAAWSATRLLSIALPWFVLSTTGSATSTGIVAFAQTAPYVAAQLFSGPLIDRLGPRRVSIVCDLTATAALAAVPLLYLITTLPFWALVALVAVAGAADGPANAAKSVFIPSVARRAGVPLERVAGLTGAIERTAATVGPAIAGVVIAAVGGVHALWIAAGLLALGALIVGVSLPDPPVERRPAESYLQRFREGARFLRGEALLRSITGMTAATNLLDQTFMAVLLPMWAKASGHGPETIGLAVSVFAATSIVASLAAAAIGDRLPRRAVYLAGYVVGGIPRFAALALGMPLPVVLVVFALGGLGSGFVNPVIGAVTYERVPAELLGRVKTLTGSLAWSGIPFGGLVGGGAIALAGLSGALWIVGGLYLVAIVVPGLRGEWGGSRERTVAAPRS